MALHWPTFFTRLGSAVVFAAVMMAGLLWNEWAFLVLVGLIMVLCLRDYFRLMERINGQPYSLKWLAILVAILVLLVAGFEAFFPADLTAHDYLPSSWTNGPTYWNYHKPTLWPILLFTPVTVLLAASLSKRASFNEAAQGIGSLIYIVLPMVMLIRMYYFVWSLPLFLILCIWANDTMAYLVGSFIGKTPFSDISPKKTWEGTVGGALLTVVGAALWAYFSNSSVSVAIAISLCAAIAGTAGDLFESKLKRLAGVKDSGTMMPGHGGALDRFDSLLVATPFAFCYLYITHL